MHVVKSYLARAMPTRPDLTVHTTVSPASRDRAPREIRIDGALQGGAADRVVLRRLAGELLDRADALLDRDDQVAAARPGRFQYEFVGAAPDRRCEDELGHRERTHVGDERLRRVPADERTFEEVDRNARRAGQPVLHPLNDLLLKAGAVRVVDRRVAATRASGPGERERLLARERLFSRAEVDSEGAT